MAPLIQAISRMSARKNSPQLKRSARMACHTAHDNPRLLSDERWASGPPGLKRRVCNVLDAHRGKAASAGEETKILLAPHRLTNAVRDVARRVHAPCSAVSDYVGWPPRAAECPPEPPPSQTSTIPGAGLAFADPITHGPLAWAAIGTVTASRKGSIGERGAADTASPSSDRAFLRAIPSEPYKT
jgi:hypothetical protein